MGMHPVLYNRSHGLKYIYCHIGRHHLCYDNYADNGTLMYIVKLNRKYTIYVVGLNDTSCFDNTPIYFVCV